MAKKILSNGWVRFAGLVLTFIVLSYGAVKGYAIMEERQKVLAEQQKTHQKTEANARETLKDEGCLPARGNVNAIIALDGKVEKLDGKVEKLDEGQKEMREENKEAFKEQREENREAFNKVLEELKKKRKKRSFILF